MKFKYGNNKHFSLLLFSESGVSGEVDAAGNYQPGDILKQVDVPKEEGNASGPADEAKEKEEISPIEYEFGVRKSRSSSRVKIDF